MAPGVPGPAVSSGDAECLFSLEFVVHRVKVDYASLALGERPLPVVAFRLLEFPTVLLYPRPGCCDGVEQSESSLGILHLSFDRGKSCLFRQSLLSLHRLLSRVPLYILLLDTRARVPLLLGSCSLSLLQAVTLLRDGNVGVPAPCWRGESGEHPLIDLMGRNVGTISLSYRLLCLGGSVVGHMGLISGQTEQINTRQVDLISSADPAAEKNKPWPSLPKPGAPQPFAETQKEQVPPLRKDQTITTVDDVKESLSDKALPGPTRQQNHPALPMPTSLRTKLLPDLDLQTELEQETNVNCPPLLYYTSDNDRKAASEKLPDGIVVEANESNAGEHEGGHLQLADKCTTKPKTEKDKLRNTQQKELGDICPEPILRQLPLLNALLHELSLLNGQLPLSEEAISSSLARPYKKGTSFEMGQTKSPPLEKSRRNSPAKLKRNKEAFSRPPSALPPCAENLERNKERVKVKPNLTKAEVSSKRKLLYGLTNTFRLRLQQTNPSGLREHERRERCRRDQLELLQQNKSRHKGLLSKTKRSQSASGWAPKGHKIPGHQRGSLDENIETLIQSNKTNTREHFFTQEHQNTPSTKVYDSRGKPVSKLLSQPDGNLKISLLRSSIQSSEVSDQEDKPDSPKFTGSSLSGTYKPNSRSSSNSPNDFIFIVLCLGWRSAALVMGVSHLGAGMLTSSDGDGVGSAQRRLTHQFGE
uniref:Microtubule-associated protein 10 C-terminal domain-containing protein n=1 Tax=Leptobrachium leishanense TaxID=445787 RepID=A0A8C5MH37_9ANUR